MSYIGNLEVISVQQVKNEKILETSAMQALILINKAQRDNTIENLTNME